MSDASDILLTERLRVRNWRENDRPLFYEINSDPKVMEFFPHRRSAEEADAFMDKVAGQIATTGYGAYALALKDTDEPIGFCALMPAAMPGLLPEETIEIGWRLARRFWGNGYVTEAARALLDYAFDVKRLDAIVSFAVPENRRSTAVMERLGLVHMPTMDFDHPRVPDTHPHLKRHIFYAITRDAWLKQRTGAPTSD